MPEGRRERGSKVAVQAARAYNDIKRQLDAAEARGWDVTLLRRRFREVRQALDALAEEERKAA